MAQGSLKCSKCSRTFAMPAHLARHFNSTHGGGAGRGRKRRPMSRGRQRGRKTAIGAMARRKAGRPAAMVSRMGLRTMGLEDLRSLIDEARTEARRRLSALKAVFA